MAARLFGLLSLKRCGRLFLNRRLACFFLRYSRLVFLAYSELFDLKLAYAFVGGEEIVCQKLACALFRLDSLKLGKLCLLLCAGTLDLRANSRKEAFNRREDAHNGSACHTVACCEEICGVNRNNGYGKNDDTRRTKHLCQRKAHNAAEKSARGLRYVA